MSEQTYDSKESSPPVVTAEHARVTGELLSFITDYVAAEGEPVLLTPDEWDLPVSGTSLEDFVRVNNTEDGSFVEDGKRVGGVDVRYVAPSGEEEPISLIVCNANGTRKTGLLAELGLEDSIDVAHFYKVMPDMNIFHIVGQWKQRSPEDTVKLDASLEQKGWLNTQEIEKLQLQVETIHRV